MKINQKATREAFETFLQQQSKRGSKAWSIPHHVEMWTWGYNAAHMGSKSDLKNVYINIAGTWQVFRGGKGLAACKIFGLLEKIDTGLRYKRLIEISDDDIGLLWQAISALKGVKKTKSGKPSTVAVSKFLHFWNPRLFVIVDRAVLWNKVLARGWLWEPFVQVRNRVDSLLDHIKDHDDTECDLESYLSALLFFSEILNLNQHIPEIFGAFVRRTAKVTTVPDDIDHYDAVAIEWLLIGLADMPPRGLVALSLSRKV